MEDFVHTIIDKERFETLQGLHELVSLHVQILFFLFTTDSTSTFNH